LRNAGFRLVRFADVKDKAGGSPPSGSSEALKSKPQWFLILTY